MRVWRDGSTAHRGTTSEATLSLAQSSPGGHFSRAPARSRTSRRGGRRAAPRTPGRAQATQQHPDEMRPRAVITTKKPTLSRRTAFRAASPFRRPAAQGRRVAPRVERSGGRAGCPREAVCGECLATSCRDRRAADDRALDGARLSRQERDASSTRPQRSRTEMRDRLDLHEDGIDATSARTVAGADL